jgi:DNA primase
MSKISDETINTILNQTDIVDIIGEKVALTKQGKSYFGLCPFHHEKTPSFSVEPDMKIYNCFSCGEKGNAVTFLQKTENLTFVEAVEVLADKANINIDFSQYKTVSPNQKYYQINQDAVHFYHLYLSNTVQGESALEYLLNRGISKDIINTFQFGLAPVEYDLLTKTLTDKEVLLSDLVDLGLTKESNSETYYDLFRSRIIIPIIDERNNVVAFSGRVYLEKDKDTAKYINSPQTKVFTKSKVLYNLNNALQFIKQSNRVLLFEGYMDVIASYRAGLKESVASMGTSLTQDQVSLMKRYTNNVTICYDGDNAGMEATQRAIQLFTNANMNVKIVLFPDKLDPDDFIAKYSEEQLADFINNKWIDRLEFAYIRNQNQFDFTKMLEVEQFKKLMFDLIKKESHTVIERYLQKISQDTKISLQSIEQDFTQYTRRTPIKNTSTNQRNKVFVENKFILAERRLLNYFIKDFRYLKDFNSFREIEYLYIDEAARDLKMKIEDLYFEQKEQVKVDEERLLLEMDDQLKQYYQSKIKNEHLEYSDVEYTDCRDVLKTYLLTQKREKLERDIANATTIEEKIALAKERDAIQKEENKWIKIR